MLCQLERLRPSHQPESLLTDSDLLEDPSCDLLIPDFFGAGQKQEVKLWKDVAFGTPAIGLNAYATEINNARQVSTGTECPSDGSSPQKLLESSVSEAGDFERAVSRESEVSSYSQLTLTSSGVPQPRVSRGRFGKRWFQKICAAMTPLPRTPSSERGREGWLSRGRRISRSMSSPRLQSGNQQASSQKRASCGGGDAKYRARSELAIRRGIGPMCVEVPTRPASRSACQKL